MVAYLKNASNVVRSIQLEESDKDKGEETKRNRLWGAVNNSYSKFVEEFFRYTRCMYKNDEFAQKAAWLLVFASFVKNFAQLYDMPIKKNSDNCVFSCVNLEYYNIDQFAKQGLFFKIIDYPQPPNQDALLADVINGRIINRICKTDPKKSDISNCFMHFHDSFLCYKDFEGTKFKLANVCRMILDNIPSSPSLPYDEFDRCQVAISSIVKGVSFGDIMSDCIAILKQPEIQTVAGIRQDVLIRVIISKISTFIKTFLYMGKTYGMVHNDLHLGNLFFDFKKRSVVCIDYGRMHFASVDKFKEIVDIEQQKMNHKETQITTYDNIIGDWLKNPYNNTNLMFIADYMTLSANLYIFFLATSEDHLVTGIKNIFKNMFDLSYDNDKHLLKSRCKIGIHFPSTDDDILTSFKTCKDDLERYLHGYKAEFVEFFMYILDGLYLVTLCLRFFHEYFDLMTKDTNGKIDSRQSCWLHCHLIFHTHFQINCSQDTFNKFLEHIQDKDNDLLSKAEMITKGPPPKNASLEGGSKIKRQRKLKGGAPSQPTDGEMQMFNDEVDKLNDDDLFNVFNTSINNLVENDEYYNNFKISKAIKQLSKATALLQKDGQVPKQNIELCKAAISCPIASLGAAGGNVKRNQQRKKINSNNIGVGR